MWILIKYDMINGKFIQHNLLQITLSELVRSLDFNKTHGRLGYNFIAYRALGRSCLIILCVLNIISNIGKSVVSCISRLSNIPLQTRTTLQALVIAKTEKELIPGVRPTGCSTHKRLSQHAQTLYNLRLMGVQYCKPFLVPFVEHSE